jgi:hypothetical protein
MNGSIMGNGPPTVVDFRKTQLPQISMKVEGGCARMSIRRGYRRSVVDEKSPTSSPPKK